MWASPSWGAFTDCRFSAGEKLRDDQRGNTSKAPTKTFNRNKTLARRGCRFGGNLSSHSDQPTKAHLKPATNQLKKKRRRHLTEPIAGRVAHPSTDHLYPPPPLRSSRAGMALRFQSFPGAWGHALYTGDRRTDSIRALG